MTKKVLHFTQPRIKALALPDKGRVEYYDDEKKNLMCRVSSTGHKSFSVVKWQGGKMQRVTIGDVGSTTVTFARSQVDNILASISLGNNPTAEKRKKKLADTKLVDVLEQYIEGRDLKPYTVKDYRYKLKLGFVDWLEKPISSITEDMVLKRHKKISQTGKTTANTTMRVLRLTLNYAVAVGMVDSNPVNILSKARLWHKNHRKDRVIPSSKLQVWQNAVEALPNEKAKVYLLMALYMGFRSKELLEMEWSHIDLKLKIIMLYDTKNGTNHSLPIPDVLLPHIKKLKKLTGVYKWVFAGAKPSSAMAVPNKPIQSIIKTTGVEFSPHDCRRTFTTIAEAAYLPMTMIKRLINHVTTNDVTGGYMVTEEATLRLAINKVADDIQEHVTQKNNIVK